MRTTTAFNARLSTLILATGFISATVGCTTRSQVFEGYGDDQLWTAMVASAQKPTYDDWRVMDNEVYVDEATRRIEVYRVLKRTLVTPYSTAGGARVEVSDRPRSRPRTRLADGRLHGTPIGRPRVCLDRGRQVLLANANLTRRADWNDARGRLGTSAASRPCSSSGSCSRDCS